MNKELEAFMADLEKGLIAAAEARVWEIPINHRTKDSVSAYKSAVGSVAAIVSQVLAKHRGPAPAPVIEKMPEPEPVVEAPVVAPVEAVFNAPEQSLFDAPEVVEPVVETRRRRRGGESDAA